MHLYLPVVEGPSLIIRRVDEGGTGMIAHAVAALLDNLVNQESSKLPWQGSKTGGDQVLFHRHSEINSSKSSPLELSNFP